MTFIAGALTLLLFVLLAILVFVAVIAVLLSVVHGTAKVGLLLVAAAAALTGASMCCVYRMPYTSVHSAFSSCCSGRSKREPERAPVS